MKNLKQFMSFAAVARNHSFAAAARELGLAPSSIAKSVARLENDLGIRLFHRTTRALRLTSEGEELFAKCVHILEDIDGLELVGRGAKEGPSGVLRIGAPIAYGTRFIVPVLNALLDAHPRLGVDVRLSDQRADLIKEGLDVAIRIGTLDDSGHIARKIGEQQLVLCAGAQYVARHGVPASIKELDAHPLVTFRMPSSGRERPLTFIDDGKELQILRAARFSLSHGEAMVQALLLGAGVAQIPLHMAAAHLKDGGLIELLPHCRPDPLPVNAIVPSARMMPPRVRFFIDAMLDAAASSRVRNE
jgi:DNA-binding transcriptional LysR family regulator